MKMPSNILEEYNASSVWSASKFEAVFLKMLLTICQTACCHNSEDRELIFTIMRMSDIVQKLQFFARSGCMRAIQRVHILIT